MEATKIYARALADAAKLELRFRKRLYVPDYGRQTPIQEIVDWLEKAFPDGLRVAILLSASTDDLRLPANFSIYSREADAVIERNEVDERPFLMLGRPRQSISGSLVEVPDLSEASLRDALLGVVQAETVDAAQRVVNFVQARVLDLLSPMELVLDYLAAVLPLTPSSDGPVRREMWRLGLVPDLSGSELVPADIKKIRDVLSDVRSADIDKYAPIRRVVLSYEDEIKIRSLEEYRSSGRIEHLKHLSLANLTNFREQDSDDPPPNDDPPPDDPPEEDPPERGPDVEDDPGAGGDDEGDFFDPPGFIDLPGGAGGGEGGSTAHPGGEPEQEDRASVDWAGFPVKHLSEIPFGSDESDIYAATAFEAPASWVPTDLASRDPDEQNSISVSLPKLLSRISSVDVDTVARETSERFHESVTNFLNCRRSAAVNSLALPTTAGFEKLIATAQEREVLSAYLTSLDHLWTQLEALTDAAQTGSEASWKKLLRLLLLLDYQIIQGKQGLSVTLAPLHPAIVVPRLRASERLAQISNEAERTRLSKVIRLGLDPAVPSIPVMWEGDAQTVYFRGVSKKGLPQYDSEALLPSPTGSSEVLTDVITRFRFTYPFVELAFSIALVNPQDDFLRSFVRKLRSRVNAAQVDVFLDPDASSSMRDTIDELNAATEENEFAGGLVHVSSRPMANLLGSEGSPTYHIVVLSGLQDAPYFGSSSMPLDAHGSIVNEWRFTVEVTTHHPVMSASPPPEVQKVSKVQERLTHVINQDLELKPLLGEEAQEQIAEWARTATWVVVLAPSMALIAPEQCGDADFLGKAEAPGSIGLVYSDRSVHLFDSVSEALADRTWIGVAPENVRKGLAEAVRRSLSEGLLTFARRATVDQVIGNVGVAGVLEQLNEDDPNSLVISLDSAEARAWLNNRPSEKRADLIEVAERGGEWVVTVHEVKTTSAEHLPSDLSLHPELIDGAKQAKEIIALVSDMFSGSPRDPLADTRREVLKRQIFLEALTQLESLRTSDISRYIKKVDSLNRLFSRDGRSKVTVQGVVWFISAKRRVNWQGHVEGIPVRVHDEDWLRRVLAVEDDVHLADGLSFGVDGDAGLVTHDLDDSSHLSGEHPDEVSSGTTTTAYSEQVTPSVSSSESQEGSEQDTDSQETPEMEVGAEPSAIASSRMDDDSRRRAITKQVGDALKARSAPVRSIDASDVVFGPSVVRIPFRVQSGARLRSIQSQEEDLARDLDVQSVRVGNLSGRAGYAFLELARRDREFPDVDGLISDSRPPGRIVSLGSQLDYSPLWVDLADLPHLLVAGKTGSGKSVFVRSIIRQLTALYSPKETQLVIADGKGGRDYRDFQEAPHVAEGGFLLGTSGILQLMDKIVNEWLVERRRKFDELADDAMMRQKNPRQISNYADLVIDAEANGYDLDLPVLVVVLDEFGQFALSLNGQDRNRFDDLVTSFAQQARYLGGHMVAATQRPSVETLPGDAKGQFARVALQVESNTDSRVILDEGGAELLLGKGDLLYKGDAGLMRLQGYRADGPYRYS